MQQGGAGVSMMAGSEMTLSHKLAKGTQQFHPSVLRLSRHETITIFLECQQVQKVS